MIKYINGIICNYIQNKVNLIFLKYQPFVLIICQSESPVLSPKRKNASSLLRPTWLKLNEWQEKTEYAKTSLFKWNIVLHKNVVRTWEWPLSFCLKGFESDPALSVSDIRCAIWHFNLS